MSSITENRSTLKEFLAVSTVALLCACGTELTLAVNSDN
jgi:outer membrane lipopolysaccharide assembly protein LptE/RlpB